METRVKDHEGELSSTRKQYEEAKANAITIGAKLNQAEKEIQALRIQHADADAEVNRYKRVIKEREQNEKEEREKKEKEERVKKESEERQMKEWCQKMETRVNNLEGELSSTRKQCEEANANVKRYKREKEEREKKEKEEREKKQKEESEKKERERRQIEAYRQEYPHSPDTDEELKTWMCVKCQGWTQTWITCDFNCKCAGNK